jgi:hypothetical protein
MMARKREAKGESGRRESTEWAGDERCIAQQE